MIEPFYHFYTVVSPTDSKLRSLFAGFAPTVDGDEEVVATAFHIKRDFPVVADDNGTYIQAVRGNGGDGDGLAVRHDDRAAHT